MKIKKLIPLLVCGAFLVTGCQAGRGGKVSNVKQKVAKGSLISQRFLSQNYGGEEANNGYTFDSARSGSDLIPSGYLLYNTNLMQYGFVTIRNESTYQYYLYSIHSGSILKEISNASTNATRVSNYVGGYVGIYDHSTETSYIYNGLGQEIASGIAGNVQYFDSEYYNSASNSISLTYEISTSSGWQYKTVTYSPDSSQPIVPDEEESYIGTYNGSIDCSEYGVPSVRLEMFKSRVDVFERDNLARSIDLPTNGANGVYTIIGNNICFIILDTLPDDANKYQFSIDGTKYNQEIYAVNYLNGNKQLISSEYYLSQLLPMKGEEGYYTLAKARMFKIKKDKTVDQNLPLMYLVDNNLTLYDNITDVDFNNPIVVETDNGAYYANGDGKVYDSQLRVVKDFSNDLTNISYSKGGKYIIGRRNGLLGMADTITGEIVCSFAYNSIYFDPESSETLYAFKGNDYITLTKSGSSFVEGSGAPVDSLVATGDGYLIGAGGLYKLYDFSGTPRYTFPSTTTSIDNYSTINLSVAKVKYYFVRSTDSVSGTVYTLIKLVA